MSFIDLSAVSPIWFEIFLKKIICINNFLHFQTNDVELCKKSDIILKNACTFEGSHL